MAKQSLSAAKMVQRGYGQVEANLLSAKTNGQIYAQLPAAASIEKLENGQFAKYDYAAGVVDFRAAGEWMLVLNEVKIYRDFENDCDFAMLKDDYAASVYSPFGEAGTAYQPIDYDSIAKAADEYEIDSTSTPMREGFERKYSEALMPTNTTMVPRLLKTSIGDIFTTNTIDEAYADLTTGDILAPRAADGILVKDNTQSMKFEVVKKYTMPDGQNGVKLMRIA